MAPARTTGGDGIVREIEVLADATVSLVTERRTSRPWRSRVASRARWARTGCFPPATTRAARRLPDKVTVHLRAGDVLRILTPGGGGYGVAGATRAR